MKQLRLLLQIWHSQKQRNVKPLNSAYPVHHLQELLGEVMICAMQKICLDDHNVPLSGLKNLWIMEVQVQILQLKKKNRVALPEALHDYNSLPFSSTSIWSGLRTRQRFCFHKRGEGGAVKRAYWLENPGIDLRVSSMQKLREKGQSRAYIL